MRKIVYYLSSFSSLIYIKAAQAGPNLSDAFKDPLKTAGKSYNPEVTVSSALSDIIYIVLGILGTMFLLLIIYGGINWMMAGGNEKNVEKGKETIKEAIIGLIVVVGAYALTYFFVKVFGAN